MSVHAKKQEISLCFLERQSKLRVPDLIGPNTATGRLLLEKRQRLTAPVAKSYGKTEEEERA